MTIQCTLNSTKIALAGLEVRREEKILSRRRIHGSNINNVTYKGGYEDLAIDPELSRVVGILLDPGADGTCLVDMPPVEIEREECLHSILSSGIVGKAELGVGV
jgi:hypothetical protein